MRDGAYMQSVAFSRGGNGRRESGHSAVIFSFLTCIKKKILFLKAGGFVLYWQKLKLGFVQTQHKDRAPVRPWVRPGCSAGLVLVSGKERSGLCGREGRSFCGQVATELLLLLIPCHPGHLEL